MNFMIYFWVLLIILMLAVEIATTALVSVWFVGGGLAALLLACLHFPVWVQIIAFAAVSALLFFTCRDWLEKHFVRQVQPTNLDSVKNAIGTVTVRIDPVSGGRALVRGQDWKAVSITGEEIAEGELVKVAQINGVKLMVYHIPKHPPIP